MCRLYGQSPIVVTPPIPVFVVSVTISDISAVTFPVGIPSGLVSGLLTLLQLAVPGRRPTSPAGSCLSGQTIHSDHAFLKIREPRHVGHAAGALQVGSGSS